MKLGNRNIRKVPIDSQKLLQVIDNAGYSIRSLAKRLNRGERTIRYYLEQGVMPDMLFEDICQLVGYEDTKPIDGWEKLWIAPSDGTYKGRCRECGFTHIFIDGHDAQYKFCPQCGSQKR